MNRRWIIAKYVWDETTKLGQYRMNRSAHSTYTHPRQLGSQMYLQGSQCHHHQERTPRLGLSCLHKSAPCILVLHSMPGIVEANVILDFSTASTVRVHVCGSGMCWASSQSVPIPWRVVDDNMKSTAKIHFWASTCYMTKQVKPSGTDGLGQRCTTCATPHFSVGHVLIAMNVIGRCDATHRTHPSGLHKQSILAAKSISMSRVHGIFRDFLPCVCFIKFINGSSVKLR